MDKIITYSILLLLSIYSAFYHRKKQDHDLAHLEFLTVGIVLGVLLKLIIKF
jgi:hypothetical protein